MNDSYYMKMAISRAEEGVKKGQSPFGAVIVRNGEVISCEHNHVWDTTDPTAHAEIIAIRNAAGKIGDLDLTGSSIYTTCEPCPMCFSAIHWARISRIIYGARVEDSTKLGFNEISVSNLKLNREWGCGIEIISDFMRDDIMKLFKIWSELSNQPY